MRGKNKPLILLPFRQTPGLCGPASLKILLSYFEKNYSEKKLTELSHASTKTGTLHEGLIEAAKKIGARVQAKDKGTLVQLKKYIHKQKLPVLIGWFDAEPPDAGDHFSVVYHITEKFIYLMDPELHSGKRKMSLKNFLEVWYDYDEDETKKIHRWYMVITF